MGEFSILGTLPTFSWGHEEKSQSSLISTLAKEYGIGSVSNYSSVAGAKLGGAIGRFFGPLGTILGTFVGGAGGSLGGDLLPRAGLNGRIERSDMGWALAAAVLTGLGFASVVSPELLRVFEGTASVWKSYINRAVLRFLASVHDYQVVIAGLPGTGKDEIKRILVEFSELRTEQVMGSVGRIVEQGVHPGMNDSIVNAMLQLRVIPGDSIHVASYHPRMTVFGDDLPTLDFVGIQSSPGSVFVAGGPLTEEETRAYLDALELGGLDQVLRLTGGQPQLLATHAANGLRQEVTVSSWLANPVYGRWLSQLTENQLNFLKHLVFPDHRLPPIEFWELEHLVGMGIIREFDSLRDVGQPAREFAHKAYVLNGTLWEDIVRQS